MYMIQIEESKVDKMSELAEKMLKYGGKLMQCIEEMSEESGIGHRGGYGMRSGQSSQGGRYYGGSQGSYGSRGGYGMRDDEDWDSMDYMGERRSRDSRGRYM